MLSKEQIQNIENYCHEKGVVYYDLEQEIGDHLASVIEQEQTHFPLKSFEKILVEKAPKFSKDWKRIEAEKKKALYREFINRFSREYISFFNLPKIGITILLMFGMFYMIKYFSPNYQAVTTLSILFLGIFNNLYSKKRLRILRMLNRQKIKQLLVLKYLKISELFRAIIIGLCFIFQFLNVFNHLSIQVAFIGFYIFPFVAISIIAISNVLVTMQKQMVNNYPLAFQN